MKKTWSLILLLILSQTACAKAPVSPFGPSHFSKTNQVVLVPWNVKEGQNRLGTAHAKNDFYQLAHFFQPQINPLYCGIASATIVLNALRQPEKKAPSQRALEVTKPQVWGGGQVPYPAYSQFTLLNEKTDAIKSRKLIQLKNITPQNTHDAKNFDPGLTLAQLKGILETYDLKADVNYADDPREIESFRAHIIKVLKDKTSFIVANFKGKTFGAPTGGHISPLAAYHKASDSVLILDVAGHKNPWYWVPVRDLYLAMHTMDGPHHRGWITIEENPS
ncbi:MAG: phytochelatin synthase family protein [Desulfovibrionales bacterium]|nr:phytochelatin synthase family protein [Desulfovibrionales bacterium]